MAKEIIFKFCLLKYTKMKKLILIENIFQTILKINRSVFEDRNS